MFARRTYDEDVQTPAQLQPTGHETMSETVGYFIGEPKLTRRQPFRSSKDEFLQGSFGVNHVWLPANTMISFVGFESGHSTLKLKQEIKNLIGKFEGEGSIFAPNFVSPDVAQNAKKFIDLIPLDRKLPKVDADGEGAMMFLWPDSELRVLVVVEADRLHIAFNATVPEAEYIPELPFDGTVLPEVLVANLPI